MNNRKALKVVLGGREVGTLAETREHKVAFEYADEWLESGFALNPFSLPLQKAVFVPSGYEPFEGLFGVFADSLPDGWGRLLLDRLLWKHQIPPAEITSLTRLAIVGEGGMGALEYHPQSKIQTAYSDIPLDELAVACKKMFDTEESEHLEELYRMGGSSGGARPKVFYKIDGEDWIVKFASSMDKKNIGKQEYDYSLCAKKCGIVMSETRLLPSAINEGYFATRRFDRGNGGKIHMVSAGGLLETSHRIPNLDYDILMQLTLKLTQSYEELEKLFRLMCFNVFAHNRDDHSKNFSYLYREGKWQLSPAYDLTYSNSIGGEHATTVNGNGKNPDMRDILEVAKRARLDEKKARLIAEEIQSVVREDLGVYLKGC